MQISLQCVWFNISRALQSCYLASCYIRLCQGTKKKLQKDAQRCWRAGNVNLLLHTHYSLVLWQSLKIHPSFVWPFLRVEPQIIFLGHKRSWTRVGSGVMMLQDWHPQRVCTSLQPQLHEGYSCPEDFDSWCRPRTGSSRSQAELIESTCHLHDFNKCVLSNSRHHKEGFPWLTAVQPESLIVYLKCLYLSQFCMYWLFREQGYLCKHK